MESDMHEFQAAHETKMSDEEAQRVMQLLAERRRRREDLSGMPSVLDVATLADAPVEEVISALQDVRSSSHIAAPVKRMKPWMIAPIALCSILLLLVTVKGVTLLLLTSRGGTVIEGSAPTPPKEPATEVVVHTTG
jgi:hypothetical protein